VAIIFFGNASLESGASGTGLGLSIVKQVVELYNGEVAVSKGIDGTGATFTVQLPIVTLIKNE
jgi:signal transduction histidine kinase